MSHDYLFYIADSLVSAYPPTIPLYRATKREEIGLRAPAYTFTRVNRHRPPSSLISNWPMESGLVAEARLHTLKWWRSHYLIKPISRDKKNSPLRARENKTVRAQQRGLLTSRALYICTKINGSFTSGLPLLNWIYRVQ